MAAAKRKTCFAVAGADAVDRRVDGDGLGRPRLRRFLAGDVGQAVRNAEQARIADPEAADQTNVIRAGRHIGRDGEAKSPLLDKGRFQTGMVEEKRIDAFEIHAGDFDFDRRSGGGAERRETVETHGGQVGADRSDQEKTE